MCVVIKEQYQGFLWGQMHCTLTVITVSTPIINYIFFAIYYSFTRCSHWEKVGNTYTLSLYYFYNYMQLCSYLEVKSLIKNKNQNSVPHLHQPHLCAHLVRGHRPSPVTASPCCAAQNPHSPTRKCYSGKYNLIALSLSIKLIYCSLGLSKPFKFVLL